MLVAGDDLGGCESVGGCVGEAVGGLGASAGFGGLGGV